MQVLLTGATGFVGSHMLARLVADSHEIRAVVRNPKKLKPPHGPGHVEAIAGDVITGAGLSQAAQGCEAVIHLVGIIMEADDATFEKVHHRGTINVANAAREAGVRRFVQMSAVGARPDGVSGYQITKWAAEEAVHSSGMEWVILRPSIIFGPRDGFVTQMVEVMRSAPLVRPVPGHGRYPFRPVYVTDVIECFAQSLTNREAISHTIALVGGEELTLNDLLTAIAECIGVTKPPFHVPFPLMYMNAAILGAILPRPPVTTDQLRMLREGSTADPEPMKRIFHLNPIGFREGLKKYLCQPATK
jgi:uncharacterized protein YbjT (DUF2867 family)